MSNDDAKLDNLFAEYRASCPEPEPGPNFMPELWARIDARRSFLFTFRRFARPGAAAAAAFCLLLLLLNISTAPAHVLEPTYADALVADSQETALYGDLARALPAAPHE